jgi:DNA polymerase-3 subunit alpha
MNQYTPLHLHTEFSPDGLGRIDDMMEYAKSCGFSHLAITDHGTAGGHVSFWSSALEHGITPIFGIEMYMLYGKRGHLTVLSSGRKGYDNLIALNNAAHKNKDKGFPLVTMEMLSEYNDGLIVLTGCIASPLYHGDLSDGLKFAAELYDIFGKERLFAEIMGVFDGDNYNRPHYIAQKLGLTCVITNDTHFVRKENYKQHRVACVCRKGFDYASQELWLKTKNELLETKYLKRFAGSALLEQLLNNTNIIAEKIESFSLASEVSLPKVKETDIISIARKNCTQHHERLEYEIQVIENKGFVDYFAILYDFVMYCKENNIKIGPGRGSGAGSYFLYLLGITGVNPVEYGLMFERFLDVSRSDMPDFDLDVESDKRDMLLDYAKEKWQALPIANYSTYSHSSLVRDIGRFFKVPGWLVNETSDNESEVQLEKFFDACKSIVNSEGEDFDFSVEDARESYNVMNGQVRHCGKHAGGIVITSGRKVPVENDKVAWTEGIKARQLSTVGLVKYDILAVAALSILTECEKTTGVVSESIAMNDNNVFVEIFQKKNMEGIFQFSGSPGISELTVRIKPNSIFDLSAINALYRPGPLDSGMAEKYPAYKKNPRKINSEIDKILEETYGVIVYQEQVMAIVALMTGGNLSEADNARKIISKGKPGDPVWEVKIKNLEQTFKSNGYTRFNKNLVDEMWKEIFTFGRYGFNKSHSMAYAFLSYRMAWYKLYYPGQFFAALLNNDKERAEDWLIAASFHVTVRTPDINISKNRWYYEDGVLFAPLSSVKYFGENQVKDFIEEREKVKKFKTFQELSKVPKKIFNSRVKKQLYLANAFNGLNGDVNDLIDDMSDVVSMSKVERQIASMGFRIPDSEFTSFFNEEAKFGRAAGFVSSTEKRNKGNGDYYVVRLLPFKTFWTKNVSAAQKLKKYDLISADVSGNGEAKNIWRKI